MAPKLFRRQLDGGAWGITVATAQQAKVVAHHGVERVLMANQLVGKRNIAIVAEMLEQPGFTFYCLVDSVEGVEQLARELAARGAARPMSVLLEVGPAPDQSGSRTGVSDDAQLEAVLAAVQRHAAHVRLAGVELYEGILKEEGEIRVFLRRSIAILQRIASAEGFADGATPILSGAGSAWYDVVAEEFAQARFARPVDLVLRPGCYLTHDVGIYRAAQDQILQRNPVAARMRGGLKPALQLWAYVQSIPRGDRAVIAFGKRDAAFDSGYPEPALHFRPGGATQGVDTARPAAAPSHWKVTGMMDQHAYMTIGVGDDLRVGDMVAFDISHPCLTFDKWRHLLLLDDDYRCIDVVETYF
jgi:D-serine dehydratase